MGILIKGGKVFSASDEFEADIRIEGEKITAIGIDIYEQGDEIIEAGGCYIFPGGIDTHTHFELDTGSTVTADDFETGTRAAIAGGTTVILDYATQNKGESLKSALVMQHSKAYNKCFCDYGFHMGITDWNKEVCEEMNDMVQEGVSSFKLYMAYKGRLQVDDGVIYEALKRSKEVGGLIGFHCENGDIIESLIKDAKAQHQTAPIYHALTRPSQLEAEAIQRVISIAQMADAPVYIVHLSTSSGLKNIMEGKRRGIHIFAETCPQYLLLDDSLYGTDDRNFEGAKYVMSPPLRKPEDEAALWQGIYDGTIVTTGTDHCSFNYKDQKKIGRFDFTKIPNGSPGVEHRMELLYTYGVKKGRINMQQYVAITSTNAAKIYGLYPNKGHLGIGCDADIVIFDPKKHHFIEAATQFQNVDYTPYEGYELEGQIRQVFLRGRLVVENREFIANKPQGKYLKRGCCHGKVFGKF